MTQLTVLEAQPQAPLKSKAYDRWQSPDGENIAEFHRCNEGILVRFPDEADFHVAPETGAVVAKPAPGIDGNHVEKLFNNAIIPTLGNHSGGLFLHGSAVATKHGAAVFLGQSRSGKTTLAGAFAKAGQLLLTEDVVDLKLADDDYWVRPIKSSLRLFPDSAEFLLGEAGDVAEIDGKQSLNVEGKFAFATEAKPLNAIFILGEDQSAPLTIQRVPLGAALPALLPHAFVLDVEDRRRLIAHFGRLADLSESVQVYTLYYPRDYSALSHVCEAILTALLESREQ